MMVSTPSFSETVKTSSSRSPIITHTTDKIERVSWFRTTTASASSGSARSTHGRRHSSSEGQTLIERTSSSRSVPACVAATIARRVKCVALAVRRQRPRAAAMASANQPHGRSLWPDVDAFAQARTHREDEGGGGEVEPVPSGGEVAAQASAAHLRHLLRETAQREACAGGCGWRLVGGGGTGRLAGGGGSGGGSVGERRRAQSAVQRSRVTQPSPG